MSWVGIEHVSTPLLLGSVADRMRCCAMRDLATVVVSLAAVITLGAAFAPLAFWIWQAAANARIPLIPDRPELLASLTRAAIFSALVLAWPIARWSGIRNWRELGLSPNERWRSHAILGFAIAAAMVAAVALVYLALGLYRWKPVLPWAKLPGVLVSALVVAVNEEAAFRGGVLGLCRRSLSPRWALLAASAVFAAVHFVDPSARGAVADVTWSAGFEILPRLFHRFAEPSMWLAGYSTLFALGWVLGALTIRTRSLWCALGFHAGLVFLKTAFQRFTLTDADALPWVGSHLEVGLVPLIAISFAGLTTWLSVGAPRQTGPERSAGPPEFQPPVAPRA